MRQLLLKSEIKTENDIIWARKKSRQLAEFFKLDNLSQIRLATAVSEIARNAFQYAGGGSIMFQVEQGKERISIVIEMRDKGPGISSLKQIMDGSYRSKAGMGVGIRGTKNLVDDLIIDTSPSDGTNITLKKIIPLRRDLLSTIELRELIDSFMSSKTNDPIEEIQKQNQEILLTLAELQEKKIALDKVNKELEETNAHINALNAELDENAVHLKLANESKTSFLSDMTHEFRSPLNSIISISNILLEDAQADKASERELQIQFIIKASNGLSTLVNDLLDIAKIEAGKIQIRAETFLVEDLLHTLKGLMTPLAQSYKNIDLQFIDVPHDCNLLADEGKVAQVLRNLVSNALKYTEQGTVTVKTICFEKSIRFCVEDTGIGIAPENLELIFSEFAQIENHLQNKNKGTGLGLPLAKKLAHLLGGSLWVESTLHQGSQFYLELPRIYAGPEESNYKVDLTKVLPTSKEKAAPSRLKKVLFLDDNESNRYQMARLLKRLPIDYREASNGVEGLEVSKVFLPDLIISDLVMPEMDGEAFISLCKADASLKETPIILYTTKELDPEQRLRLEKLTVKIIYKDAKSVNHILKAIESYIR